MNESIPIHRISLAIYNAVHAMQQQQPDFLQEKYRSQSWGNAQFQAAFVQKLGQRLERATNSIGLSQEVNNILEALIAPEHWRSASGQQLAEGIRVVIESLFSAQHQAVEDQTYQGQSSTDDEVAQRLFAILLLDAENLQPDLKVEAFLAKACTYPLQVKVAFANWRKLGKYDVDLHNRDYDLIHVPSGQDMADGKMLMFGSSIHDRYPTAKEVLVCSSDKVMSNLCTKLRQEGLIVYRVQKQKDDIIVSNSATGQQAIYSLSQTPIPTIEVCITQLKQLIKVEQQQTGSTWVKLSRISKLFRDQQGVALSQVVSAHTPGKKARNLFTDHPRDFAIHQPSEQTELYVSVFDEIVAIPAHQTECKQIANQPKLDEKVSGQRMPSTQVLGSREALEQAIVKIIVDLSSGNGSGSVDLSKLGSLFSACYGQPITAVTKQLQPPQKLMTFLKSCKALVVEPNGKGWDVRCTAKAQKALSKGT